MSRPRIISVISILAALVCSVLTWQSCASKKPSTSARVALPPQAPPASYPPIARQQARGLTAIPVSRPGQVPAFTTEELGRFAETHPIPNLVMIDIKTRVIKVDCGQTEKSVSSLLRGKETGLPDGTRLCYVELQGRFAISGPRSVSKPPRATSIFNTAFEVFDANTGNLLLSGGFTHPVL